MYENLKRKNPKWLIDIADNKTILDKIPFNHLLKSSLLYPECYKEPIVNDLKHHGSNYNDYVLKKKQYSKIC